MILKHTLNAFLMCLLLFASNLESSNSNNQKAITFCLSGRLGDNLLDYTHAKWISYKWGIPLLLNEFEYSDQFLFDDVEEKLTPEIQALYEEQILTSFSELDEDVARDTLYFAEHIPDSYDEFVFLHWKTLYIPVDWKDEVFRDMMRSLITPKVPLDLIYPPKGVISVALHFRTGGGFHVDTSSTKRALPLRFPAKEYYMEQLQTLYKLVQYQPLYVHIFTDSTNPDEIKEFFQKKFRGKNIEFSCRAENNRHDANVLEDMFSMMNFDCLIRPMSHFSLTASHLGNFKIEIGPKDGHWKGPSTFIVHQVNIIQNASWDNESKTWVSLD